ncbi:MAG: RHS repeat-associated core domain-containing protein, partial [Armatimonadota bacterium]
AAPGGVGGFGEGWGYESETATNLVRIGHRMYDPDLGTFLSRDPALEGANPYAYADGDPVNAVDPDGLEVLVFLPKGPNVPTRGGGRTRGRLILIGDDGRWIREWPANSGGSRAPGTSVPPGYPTRLPKGVYDLDNPRRRRTKGMVREEVGFSIDLEPRFPTSRRYLRIHPDGGGPGTQGCIGVLAPGKDLDAFYRIVRGLIQADRLHLIAQ